ncbi:MAG TPA: hypothetical protein PLM71_07230 [Syntrophorhabdaceae bacterium]|nr:hypothetical protein [Syntrophorhabdaceae bacterium]
MQYEILLQIVGWILALVGSLFILIGSLIAFIFNQHIAENRKLFDQNREEHKELLYKIMELLNERNERESEENE